jgi:hypothetical protein
LIYNIFAFFKETAKISNKDEKGRRGKSLEPFLQNIRLKSRLNKKEPAIRLFFKSGAVGRS